MTRRPARARELVRSRDIAATIRPVAAPTVVILAAGRGHAHALGDAEGPARPLRAAAGRLAGRRGARGGRREGRGRRRRPTARSTACCRTASTLARPGASRAAPATPSARPRASIDPDAPVVVLVRRRAADHRRGASARSRRPTTRAGAAATMVTMVLDDPAGYGRVVRDADGSVERVVETKAPGDATPERARDPRGQHRRLRVRPAARCSTRSASSTADNAQGELLPARRARRSCATHGRRVAALRRRRPGARRSASTTASTSRGCARIAQRRIHERHMRAGVTIVDPALDLDRRRRRRSARDTVIEPCTYAARRDARRRRLPRSARSRR